MEETDKKGYEISFLLRREEDVEAILKPLAEGLGEVLSEGQLTMIKLAYPVQKETSAYFGWIHFSMAPENVKKMSGTLKLDARVLRYLIITPPISRAERRPRIRPSESTPAAVTEPVSESRPKEKETEISNEALEKRLEEILK
ncbi:MAG TPA: 30S ribosomal protein S6 [Candidatus Tyrphobacter sp.]|nr:30S ribosomal protein S6 [Candidatus Tyrphobacter sp.]